MRKFFFLMTLLCCLSFGIAAQAAQVTDAKWGVDKNNVLRLVVDVDDTAGYAVEFTEKELRLTVQASASPSITRYRKIKSTVADGMQVLPGEQETVILLPLKKTIGSDGYKAFTLRKDPATKRPFRVVLDVVADKRVYVPPKPVLVEKTADSNAAARQAAGSNPVVSNRPVKNTVIAKEEGASNVSKQPSGVVIKPTKPVNVKTDAKKAAPAKNEAVEAKDKAAEKASKTAVTAIKKDKETADGVEIIKSKHKFKTKGDLEDMVITIDPGHGGSDPGAIGKSGLKEKTVTLEISKRVKELLEKKDAKVYMTRTDDKDVHGPRASDRAELQARVNVAEKHGSDLFISIHINSSVNKKVGGFSTYYYPKTQNDLRLANHIQKKLADNFGVDNLGVREANFYITKRSSMPAALLELCFISNEKEEKLIQSRWFQKKAARMIVDGIKEYFEKGTEERK